jgi:hypothetical protein
VHASPPSPHNINTQTYTRRREHFQNIYVGELQKPSLNDTGYIYKSEVPVTIAPAFLK